MSRISFHHAAGPAAELSGAERAHMAGLADALFLASLGPIIDTTAEPSWLWGLLSENHFARRHADVANAEYWLRLALRPATTSSVRVAGRDVDLLDTALNTALVAGSDAVKLAARLHGQCELHAWVDGPDRLWLAGVVETGLAAGVFRRSLRGCDLGWDAVVDLLLAADDSPVVTSYSVTESFPDVRLAAIDRTDDWDSLLFEEQWELSMLGLRARRDLQLRPGNWASYFFGEGLNGFQLYDRAAMPA